MCAARPRAVVVVVILLFSNFSGHVKRAHGTANDENRERKFALLLNFNKVPLLWIVIFHLFDIEGDRRKGWRTRRDESPQVCDFEKKVGQLLKCLIPPIK